MSIINDLKQLDELYRAGSLSEQEFEQAKAAILMERKSAMSDDSGEIKDSLAEIARQQELARIDREWDQKRESYMVSYRHGDSHYYGRRLPSRTASVVGGLAMFAFGIFWIVMTSTMNAGPVALVGVAVCVIGVIMAISEFSRAEKLEAAEEEYHRRRRKVMQGEVVSEELDLNPFPSDERSDEQPLNSIFK